MAGALIGVAVALGACTHTDDAVATASIPEDYRLRHPIAIEEANHSIVVFVGQGARRAFRRTARRRDGPGRGLATRGNRRDQRRRAGRHPQRAGGRGFVPGNPGAARGRRRAAARARRAPLSPGRSAPHGGDPAELSENLGGGRALRPVAGGPRAFGQEQGLSTRTSPTTISAAPISATWRRWSTIRPISCSRGPKRLPIRCDAAKLSRNIARVSRPRPLIPRPTRPNSATQANDQLRPSKSEGQPDGHATAGGRSHRAGAAGVRAGLLRDGGNRCRRAVGRRGPPPRQGPPQDPDGRHGGRDRGLSLRADAERDRAGNRRPRRYPRRPRPTRNACAIPAPALS